MSVPIETPKPGVKETTVSEQTCREWRHSRMVRARELATDRAEVQRLLTLRRSVAAHYYDEWGIADTCVPHPVEWCLHPNRHLARCTLPGPLRDRRRSPAQPGWSRLTPSWSSV